MKLLLNILFLVSSIITWGQKEVTLSFELKNDFEKLTVNQLRYYVSSIELLNGEVIAYSEKNSYHLVDHSEKNSTQLILRIPENIEFDVILFNLGVDSAKNMQGVHGGDLDPTKGMYWTWQSGYINFKLEATVADQELSYHIGGFMYPNNACRKVKLSCHTNEYHFHIQVDPEQLLEEVDYENIKSIMSPGKSANFIADLLPSIFSLK